jgi:hypothetical protein
MPVTPLTEAVYKIELGGSIAGAGNWSTGHYVALLGGSGMTQADLDADATGIATLHNTLIASFRSSWCTNTTYTFTKVTFYQLGAVTPTLTSEPTVGTQTGSDAGDSMPPQCALVLTPRSNRPGRSGRGRMYFPFTSPSKMDVDGQVQAADVSSLNSSLRGYFVALNASTPTNGGTFVSSVASWTHGFVTALTSVTADSKVDTQRRRADKVHARTFVQVAI